MSTVYIRGYEGLPGHSNSHLSVALSALCAPCRMASILSGKPSRSCIDCANAISKSASFDILRLYDLKEQEGAKHAAVPYTIVPGHRTGVISQLYLDPTCTFMISTGGNRGWEGSSTEVLLGYEIHVL